MRTVIIKLIGVLLVAGLAVPTTTQAAPLYQLCNLVRITSPESGDEVRGFVAIEGSAALPSDLPGPEQFQFYKVEYSTADQPDTWRAVSRTYDQPKPSGTLDTWNTPALPDGEYNLKLTVVDRRGQEVCRDIVRDLSIANTEPISTPTPETPPTLPGATPTPSPVATATPAAPTPTPTSVVIIPTRQPTFPELDTIQETVSGAFEIERLQNLTLLGAATTLAIFAFIGVVTLLRRII